MTDSEIVALVNALQKTDFIHNLHGQAAATIERLHTRAREAEAMLDEASPRQKCARCGGEFRWHQMVAEEGDEWECFPCNDRENARERAAMGEGEK